MKRIFSLFALAVCVSACTFGTYPSQQYPGSTQQNPDDAYGSPTGGTTSGRYGRPADPGVQVTNIRLTPQYTILYLTFTDQTQPQYDRNNNLVSSNQIEIDPTAQLVAANGARTFRFIKAEGIPIKPQQRRTLPGDQVNFVLYFERLDQGLENFDLFECNDTDQFVCWNMYDLRVNNPANVPYTPAPQPTRPRPTYPPTPSQSGGEIATPKPEPTTTALVVTGTVRDAKTNRPLTATIDYKLSSSRQSVDSVQSFASTGAYRMPLSRGQVYTYVVSARGYLVATGTLDLTKATGSQRLTRDILLTPLSVGDKITLKNIYFEMSKSDLLPASFAELNQIRTMMQDNPQMRIRLEGHTDIIGDHDKNRQLSQDRVAACQQYLLNQGVAENRIQTIGYGDSRPILTKGTDEERKVNRRVEFVILSI